jgi:hypothetical protein
MKKFIQPAFQLTLGSTIYTNAKMVSADVVRVENGYDTATFILENGLNLYPDILTNGSMVTLKIRDATKESAYPTAPLFNGTANFPRFVIGHPKLMTLKTEGAGISLKRMVVAEEYGYESRKGASYDTLSEVIPHMIDNWVEINLDSGNASGYTVDTSNTTGITDTIPYISFPYKYANKCLDDLCDLETAIKAGSAGTHWIVDTSGNLRVKLIGGTQIGWTKYYGDSQTNATLTASDFSEASFEPMGKEANQIIYYGQWRRPSSGDAWTNLATANISTCWGANGYAVLTGDTTYTIVGGISLKCHPDSGTPEFWYPSAKNAAWDFTFSEFLSPSLNLYVQCRDRGLLNSVNITLYKDDSNYIRYTCGAEINDTFSHIQLPIGPYYKQVKTSQSWATTAGTIDAAFWTDINWIGIDNPACDAYIDGLYFGGIPICRVAREKYTGAEGGTLGETTNPVKTISLIDNIGKDDSLKAGDDSGLLAKFAYAELLRLQKTAVVGTWKTTLLHDLMPGQFLYYDGKDWRVTKVTHHIERTGEGCYSIIEVTDDVTNGHARPAYEDKNKLYAAIRPDYQDRQASNIKAGDVDIRVLRLEKAY